MESDELVRWRHVFISLEAASLLAIQEMNALRERAIMALSRQPRPDADLDIAPSLLHLRATQTFLASKRETIRVGILLNERIQKFLKEHGVLFCFVFFTLRKQTHSFLKKWE